MFIFFSFYFPFKILALSFSSLMILKSIIGDSINGDMVTYDAQYFTHFYIFESWTWS